MARRLSVNCPGGQKAVWCNADEFAIVLVSKSFDKDLSLLYIISAKLAAGDLASGAPYERQIQDDAFNL